MHEGLQQMLLNSVVTSELVPRRHRAALMRRCGIEVADGATVFGGQRFRPGRIRIGARVLINRRCLFDPGTASITIGDDVTLAANVVVSAAGHLVGPSRKRAAGAMAEPVVIEDGCWLGAASVVLPGVTVRRGCIIGAGAVVTRDTEPDGVYVGVPAARSRDLD